MLIFRGKPGNKLLLGAISLVLLAFGSAYWATERSHPDATEPPGGSATGDHAELIRTLVTLESALKTNMSVQRMQWFAAQIETEIKAHPLPHEIWSHTPRAAGDPALLP